MKKKIRFLIWWLVCILVVIAFVIYSNNLYAGKEQELLSTVEEWSIEDYCIKWIKEEYQWRTLYIKSIIKEKIWWMDSVHWELLLGSNKEYFCMKDDELKIKSRWGLSQLLVWEELFDNR